MSAGIRFGVDNLVELCTLTATPAPVTELDNLKTDWRARQSKWNNFQTNTIVIEGTLETPTFADFFSIPGSNLTVDSSFKLELFATSGSTTDILNMPTVTVATPLPLGVWRSGVHTYGEEGLALMSIIYTNWFDAPILWQRFKLTINHGFPIEIATPNVVPKQDPVSHLIVIEAESGTVVNKPGNTWAVVADSTASGGYKMFKSGPTFYNDPNEGPRINFSFTASATGVHTLWARVKAPSLANSFYTIYNGSSKHHWLPLNSNWHWVELRDLTLIAEQTYSLVFAARDYSFTLDKLEIRPPESVDPVDEGEVEESDFGTVESGNSVLLRMLFIGQKLELTENYSHGNTVQFLTDNDLQETASGYYSMGKMQQLARKMVFNLDMMTPSDKIALVEMEVGNAGRPFIISAYPGESEWVEQSHTMLAMFNSGLLYGHQYDTIFNSQLTIFET